MDPTADLGCARYSGRESNCCRRNCGEGLKRSFMAINAWRPYARSFKFRHSFHYHLLSDSLLLFTLSSLFSFVHLRRTYVRSFFIIESIRFGVYYILHFTGAWSIRLEDIFIFHRGIRLDWSIYSQHSIVHGIGV